MQVEDFFNEECESQNGALEVKGGFVKIYDPVGDGSPAVILPDPLSLIKLNDKEIETSQKVYAGDKVEIIPRVEEIPGKVEVELAEKNLLAKIRIIPRITIKRKIKDVPKQYQMSLDYEEERYFNNEVTLSDALQALNDKGVVFGIDSKAVEKAVQEANGDWQVVARGKEATNGKDGYLELLFEPDVTFFSYNEGDLSRVNYREKVKIPAVEAGDRLAVIHPAISGEPGYLVTGEKIDPPAVKEIKVFCKDGCELNEKGDLVLATKTGRPVVKGKNHEKFSVLPLYIHAGDVDLKSGNIHFNGELKITGDITEGMTAESQGNLEIQGNTAGACIVAGKNAVFHNNIINSNVTAGGLKALYLEMLPLLQEIEELFLNIEKGFEQLKESLSRRGTEIKEEQTGQLVKLLVERKYESLPRVIEDVFKLAEETVFLLPHELKNTINEVYSYFQAEGFKEIKSIDHLEQVVQKVYSARLLAEKNQEIEGDIVATYVQNSKVAASGNISLTGTGCYNSIFNAKGSVHIEGVFRGGEIKAQKNIFIGEAGSPGLLMKQGEIHLSANAEARFRKIYENVQVFFGKRAYKFDTTRKMVKVYYDVKDDTIKIINLA